MFTYKFVGLDTSDAPTPYYYGSLPAKPERGHILVYKKTGNRYAVVGVDGGGLEDDGYGDANQEVLAWAEIARNERVPTLRLQKIAGKETQLTGRETEPHGKSFSPEEMKASSQKNRKTRRSKP